MLRGRSRLSLLGGSNLRSVAVHRLGERAAAVVGRLGSVEPEVADAFLAQAAAALGPVVEREQLLEHSSTRERMLTGSVERRLMRLGFDLHDGPIQNVLALAADVRLLQQQVYPFVLAEYREQTAGRFDDLTSRLTELDRELRELAHSLETKSVISRPLGEILHRELDNLAERTQIATTLEIRGDPDTLSSGQRITIFRAIQEALANIREHSGATSVVIRVRARRSAIEVQITDDGMGFEVERALAKAAQRGRLGLVGIAERVRMVGGTFELDSAPGGPTNLKLTLPRWEPLRRGETMFPPRAPFPSQLIEVAAAGLPAGEARLRPGARATQQPPYSHSVRRPLGPETGLAVEARTAVLCDALRKGGSWGKHRFPPPCRG